MNIVEAIRSGRSFKRKGEDFFRGPFERGPGWNEVRCELSDFFADDFEIHEPKVTITRAQFWEAVTVARSLFWPDPAAKVLARRLGLEDGP